MTIALIAAGLSGVSLVIWRAAHGYRIAKRETQRDELRFLLSPVIGHSTADRILSEPAPQ